ncbi:MAG TPA: EAL domain-containing protein [Solirubrobacteraceae bacterium]|jgi:EAL domain-containing protein (putative c-di-GMP-specific phosphodiesterase class I)|nr:EAL domain-containing protein [Solirubrobacteraceae bacterium]
MGSSTTTAGRDRAPRFTLRAQGALASNAGLHPRPWLARLRRALREDAFVLHFQPIVALADGAVSHSEALVRLADEPDGRLVAPGDFLPAAERYGLVREIDRLVVTRVAALLGAEPRTRGQPRIAGDDAAPAASDAPQLTGGVALNLSALSVTDRGMLAHIERELARNRADPRRLIVEITETAAISDMRRARAFCAGVQSLGCSIALDDFGVGFGSFYYAKRLPFGFLKIDGDFVRELPASRNDRLVVKAIVDVARGMGRRTIAEFVGDDATLEVLRELRVDYAQGFHVGRPAPLAA